MPDLPPPGRERDAMVAKALGTPFQKPRHGNCCTCQDCGWYHDECKCGYSTTDAGAIAALEAAVEKGLTDGGYQITRREKLRWVSLRARDDVGEAAPTLGDAASAAIIAAAEEGA